MRTIRDCGVAVVGGAGFLGSHLVNHLIDDRGCKVLVLDNLCAGRLEFVHRDAEFVHHDITGSEERMQRLFCDRGIKFVFSYAAYPYIPVSFARPLHVADVNFMGAIKVINAAQEAGCEAILQVSSAEIYGEGAKTIWSDQGDLVSDSVKLTEDAPVRPHSSYGVAKAAVDYYVQCAWKERQTPCIALRQFNCVGERETHPYIIPEIIGQLAKAQDVQEEANVIASQIGRPGYPVIKLGNNSFRDFIYAGDAVRIAVELLERGSYGEVYNLGSESGVKIYDLAKLIGKPMGFTDVQVVEDPARKRPWEIWHLQSDNTKLVKQVYGHTSAFKNYGCEDPPKKIGTMTISHPPALTPLEESLKRTIAWFESNNRRWPWEK